MNLADYSKRFQNTRSAEKYAARFDRGPRSRISARETAAVRRIMAGLPGCDTVADIPCGAGRMIPALAHPGRSILGYDISQQLLEIAGKRHGSLATFARGDAAAIPLPDAAVDCVFCNRLLHHLIARGERLKVMRELRRVTRNWGVISFFDYHRGAAVRRVTRWLKRSSPGQKAHPTKLEFVAELEESGFTVDREVRAGAFWSSESYFVVRAR